MRRSLLVAAVLLGFGGRPSMAVEIFPLDQVRPGMTGVGRTVFEGSKVEEFAVHILGVLENAIGPKQSVVIARLEGGPLERTGVIAGMSGSPVLIDGKLLGAVAYGFPFSKETIAGITPIGEMIDATSTPAPRPVSARFNAGFGPRGVSVPLDRQSFVAALQRPLKTLSPDHGSFTAGGPGSFSGLAMSPLSLPLVFSGFEHSTFEWARGVFGSLGFTPVLGGGEAGVPPGPLPDLQPGGAVGVTLIEGDMDLSVTGTITHIDGDRVYAFGHPFYNLGPTQFPMKKAYVYSVFPSLYQSWKISTAARDAVGTIEQDRVTAIAGRLGKPPRMIPVQVKLETSRGQERKFSFRMVEDELFSPVLAYVSLASVLQATERTFGTSTIRVDAKLTLAGGREVRVEDLFTLEQPSLQAAALVAAPLAYVMSNDFERVAVDKLEVSASSYETIQTASLQRAWVERSGPIRPGSLVTLKLLLRTYRGETLSETIPVVIPAAAPAGTYTLLIADAAGLDEMEQREMRQPFVPRDLDQLIRAINGLRHNNHVYARLLRNDDGAIVSGEFLQSLPPSVLSVLGATGQAGNVIPIRTASVWDFDLPTDYAVSGSRLLTLNVER
jgi:SpoIVB peptidase S55